jgi:hypothetical protein
MESRNDAFVENALGTRTGEPAAFIPPCFRGAVFFPAMECNASPVVAASQRREPRGEARTAPMPWLSPLHRTQRGWIAALAFVLAVFALGVSGGVGVLAQIPPQDGAPPISAPPELDPPEEGEIRFRDSAKGVARRAQMREAIRKRTLDAARIRGITPEDLRAMPPEQRVEVLRQLRSDLGWQRAPGWRTRMIQRRLRAGALMEKSPNGGAVVRAQIVATDPSPGALQRARALGFNVVRDRSFGSVGVRVVVLSAPPGMGAEAALARLRALDPAGSYDYNHLFDPSFAPAPTDASPGGARPQGFIPGAVFEGRGARIGIIDTGVDLAHPALAGARITTRSFVEAGAEAETGHGTAVAALLVGAGDGYAGVIPRAQLFVADVFGSSGAGGSADAIVDGLAWLDSQNVDVINISLEGPPNAAVAAVIAALVRRGRTIVAAVGNAGPTRPVAYPAAYDGVIGVTAIDIDKRVYIAANRGPQVDLAALGVNVLVADDAGAYATASGTSFAAPLVAAAAANARAARDPAARVAALESRAIDLGAPGRDPVYGAGALELARAR